MGISATFAFAAPEVSPKAADPEKISQVAYNAIRELPKAKNGEFLSLDRAGGYTGLSAWQMFTVELHGPSPGKFIALYLSAVSERLTAGKVVSNGVPLLPTLPGLRPITFRSADGRVTGTIAITIKIISEDKLLIVVSSAVSP